ncbi:Plasmodium exported protein, unknown function [Plasmodium vivax]|uniref:Pv-fam-b protein n=1 Tax=Plasmodium vivax TaxID=5855 RepID=A0A564ZPT0_PLAVI|nr:Plasmodium exported protein, unknown function [Plasmodium vivax]
MMIATLPKAFLLVFLPLPCQYDSGLSSWSTHLKGVNRVSAMSQLRNGRLLLAEIDTELESVSDAESTFTKNTKGNSEDLSDVETVYEESLSNDVKEKTPLKSGSNLSYSEDNKKLEEIEKKAISKYQDYKKKMKELEEQLNVMKQKVMSSKMINIADHTKKIGETVEKIKSMKDKVLSEGMTKVVEYQKRLDEALEKINVMKEKLKKQNIMNAELLKMLDHQKALKEVKDFIKTKYDVVVPSALDSMKRIKEKKIKIPNPVGMLDSKIEKKLFETCSYMDEREHDPNISKKQFWILKIKKYGAIFAIPLLVLLPGLGVYGIEEDSLRCVLFGFAAVCYLMFFYILVKVLKYDLKSNGVKKPRFKDYVESFKRCIKGVAP